ncbi:hypothetical protein [Methylobacterium sp. E-046]|uniref:hypothetical protein n=1 Tax=Methylobacterium sp. E-046 TaxID=2836576 RepID=UPI001FBAA42B|nr:hypothetical protein [Methylobacterium sp. E-046]MCJ2103615.1 hypothetical protein [Methylobacterium sp. E-046]
MPKDCMVSSGEALAALPTAVFVERWRIITGEPPAVLLSSRAAMLALLVDSVPLPPLLPPVPTWDRLPPGDRTDR